MRERPTVRDSLAADHVEIAVEAVALNFRDVLYVLGMDPTHRDGCAVECAGRVRRVGAACAHVAPGENATVRFASDAGSLGVVSSSGAKLLMAGRYRIEIGSVASPASRELELRGASAVVEENRWAQAPAGKSGVR